MRLFFKNKISRLLRAGLLAVVALGFSAVVSGTVSQAAVCVVRNQWGEDQYFDTFSEGWCYTLCASSKDWDKMTTIKLLTDWRTSSSKQKVTIRGEKYTIGKYNLGTDLKRKHIRGLDDSKSEIDGFSGGHINVKWGRKITIDLNGFNIDRGKGNDQDDDGELINVSDGACLCIIDSNPNVRKNIDGVDTTGGCLMGGSSEDGAGCIHIKGNALVKMVGGNICCNQTDDHGGGIKTADSNSKLILDGVHFFKNQTRDSKDNCNGGAVYINKGRVRIKNCVFRQNYSEDYGGAVFMDDTSAYAVIENCQFLDNYAKDDGGAIHVDHGNLKIKNCTFSGNHAQDDGGAILIEDDEGAVLRNCTFTGNTAEDDGGAYYCDDNSQYVIDCDFHGNRANDCGGGIYVADEDELSVQGEVKVFDNSGKGNRSDNVFLAKGYLYSGGLLDGSRIGVRTNKKYKALIQISQYELDKVFFFDSGSYSKKNTKTKNEVYLSSAFASFEGWIIVGLSLVILLGALVGYIFATRAKNKKNGSRE
ncbi:MAG: hypothetical protein K6G65_10580 [Lachnospiraceae bacterium]|nr:hypothetical protein [Lachnospiraceae bacterium]